jgi:DeoR family glycerol-3-phosphate regulon repressor
VWLVADQDKFGRKALVRMAELAQIDVLFTDAPPPVAFKKVLQQAKVRLVVAG